MKGCTTSDVLPLFLVVFPLACCTIYGQATTTSTNEYKLLHEFGGSDGATPNGALVSVGSILYGVTDFGGVSNAGTVFAVRQDGSGFTNLHSFTGSDGQNPFGGLVASGNTLFGTTAGGGSFSNGTVFTLSIDGTGFKTLHTFSATESEGFGFQTNEDGLTPVGELVISSNRLYGVTEFGGANGEGDVFSMNQDGSDFTVLHFFYGGLPKSLVLSGDFLYGCDSWGIFKLRTDGSGFEVLYSVDSVGISILSNTVYGVTAGGNGAVFAVNTDGTGFRVLNKFTSPRDVSWSGVVVWGDTIFGTVVGGPGGVFALNTDGSDFRFLHDFAYWNQGVAPNAALITESGKCFGSTTLGGSLSQGVIFSLDLNIRLAVGRSARSTILVWPIHPTGFKVQSAEDILFPVWTDLPFAPALVNDQNILADPYGGTQRFYRLVR